MGKVAAVAALGLNGLYGTLFGVHVVLPLPFVAGIVEERLRLCTRSIRNSLESRFHGSLNHRIPYRAVSGLAEEIGLPGRHFVGELALLYIL